MMSLRFFPVMAVMALVLQACDNNPSPGAAKAVSSPTPPPPPRPPQSTGTVPKTDTAQRLAAAELKADEGPVSRDISKFKAEIRGTFDEGRYDELEKIAEELRASQATFGNGSWKIFQFYSALNQDDRAGDEQWNADWKGFLKWAEQYPQSVTPRIALANFLTSYAWKARGGGYANTVTDAQWKLFRERLEKSSEALMAARKLGTKDPMFYTVAGTLALGQGWPPEMYAALVNEGMATFPTYWSIPVNRAYSLLPRWQGEPGDWEKFAEQAAEFPGGLGNETYARIVNYLQDFYGNIFKETSASWPQTKAGLEIMRQKYPESKTIINVSAKLACLAGDRELAREMFAQMGNSYTPSVWSRPEQVVKFRESVASAE